jgi:SprT-like protein
VDDDALQAWVERISLESFGLPFRHRATFNRRLRSTGGRYFLKTHNIEINPKQLEQFGPEETEKIIKHELCHYHLHLANRGFRHRDRDFMELLARVGGSRYCRHLHDSKPRRPRPARYMLKCAACGTEYLRRRRMDPRRYACGRCGGKLQMFMLDSNIES